MDGGGNLRGRLQCQYWQHSDGQTPFQKLLFSSKENLPNEVKKTKKTKSEPINDPCGRLLSSTLKTTYDSIEQLFLGYLDFLRLCCTHYRRVRF